MGQAQVDHLCTSGAEWIQPCTHLCGLAQPLGPAGNLTSALALRKGCRPGKGTRAPIVDGALREIWSKGLCRGNFWMTRVSVG
jgi:hypothetical protein